MKLQDLIGQPSDQMSPSSLTLPKASTPALPANDEDIPDDFFDEQAYVDQGALPPEVEFQANLALHMEEADLKELGAELLQLVDDDEDLRGPWMDQIILFKEQIGIGEESSYEEPFPGASSVTYPIFTKAQIQFQARALPQIFPNDPAQAVVLGESTPPLIQQSGRVEDVLNFQIQYQDKGNRKDFRKMLWWLPITGSAFRYGYHNPLLKKNMMRFIPIEDFVVPYGTVTLEDSPRFSHKFRESRNDLLKLMKIGYYREIEMPENTGLDEDRKNYAQEMRDAGDGQERRATNMDGISSQECVRIYIDRDLPGFEDKFEDGEKEGEHTGIALPYCITIHRDSEEILSIRRNWKEDDELKIKRIYYAHYKYQEGPGFYGSGLPHLIGSLQTATTGALRAFGDALAFSIMQAGWKLKSARVADTDVMSPGKFIDVDMDIDDINKSIKIADFPPPSNAVLEYIKMLDEEAQAIVSIQDIMTGDASPQNSPVGTTVALIEQASKVISAQHESLYESFSDELNIMFDLNYDYLPESAQFAMPGKVLVAQRADFDCRQVAVQPTADPQVSSFQQRQAIDQATNQILSGDGAQFARNQGYDLKRRTLVNMGVPAIDEIMLTPEEWAAKMQQQQQNPPPPPPQVIAANAKMQEAQTNAQQAQAQQQQQQQQMQFTAQQSAQQNQIALLKLKLQEEQMKLNAMLEDKSIDATVFKTVTPALMAITDNIALAEGQSELTSQQQEMQEHAMQHKQSAVETALAHAHQFGQQSVAPQMAQQAAAQQPPQMAGQPGQAPGQMQGQPPQQQQNPTQAMQLPPMTPHPMPVPMPPKQNILARIMSKIKGRA